MQDDTQPEQKNRIKYLICGCGSTGYHILRELSGEEQLILIIEQDEKRVQELRDEKYDARTRDMKSPDLLVGIPPVETAFVMSDDPRANLNALKLIKAANPQAHVVIRAADPLSAGLMEEGGADLVLYPQLVVAQAAVRKITRLSTSKLSQRLFSILGGYEGTLGIITHNNPDPDAISSALALASIAREANQKGLKTRIFYDGTIGHQENRTLVNLLDIRMERLTMAALADCQHLALVDCPAPGVNNSLPSGTRIEIIIDHHGPLPYVDNASVFVDLRSGIGATASILTQYLQELELKVDKKVATGLLYGIRSDTKDFRRGITPQDLVYAAYLLPLSDPDLLDKIISPSLSMETLDILGMAITKRRIMSGYLFSDVGFIRNRDALPQAADLLINLEGVNTALVYGITDSSIVISARNRDLRLHIGNVFSEAFGDIGDAGGHANMAAAAIPLSYFSRVSDKEALMNLVISQILEKFSDIVGLDRDGNGQGITKVVKTDQKETRRD
jgi:nanoRNase/pAp phosphatase (c-di-AMP/oligoRNAs hydrolase)